MSTALATPIRDDELRFAYRERGPRLAAVRLAHELPGLPYELTRRGRTWELAWPLPDVARLEYKFELIHRNGRSEWIVDPDNPLRASGPWGEKSVLELPGYRPPEWLEDKRVGELRPAEIESRVLRRTLPALLWSHPDAHERSPLLLAHDGPEYAEHSSLATLLGRLPPLRAVLLAPVERNEIYSASARYARALADEILPSFGDASIRIGMGASLGALALLHAHRRHPETLRRAPPAVRQLLPPPRPPRALVPTLRPHLALRRHDTRPRGGAPDPGHDRLRYRRGELPGQRRDVRGPAPPALRRPVSGVPRRPQLGGVARLPSTPTSSGSSKGRENLSGRHVSLWSPAIGAEGNVLVYGHWGRPVLAFPSQQGPAWQYEERGMVDAIGDLIEAGRVKLYAVDSYDSDSWYRDDLPLEERARQHARYEDWILNQVVPYVQMDSDGAELLATGVSFGAYHAANFVLKHAHVFPLAICQSGVYDVSVVAGGERGDAVYFNNPADFVAHLGGDHLDWLRDRVSLLLVCGQGQWEDTTGALESTRSFAALLGEKGIRHELDVWGHDVPHDWPSWRAQFAHHLPRFC